MSRPMSLKHLSISALLLTACIEQDVGFKRNAQNHDAANSADASIDSSTHDGGDGDGDGDSDSDGGDTRDGCAPTDCSAFGNEFLNAACECEPCHDNGDCEGALVCAPGTGCVACTDSDSSKCDLSTPVCLTGGNTCVQCNASSDCKDAGNPICGDDHLCRPCADDNDCAPAGLICDEAEGPTKGQCVACTQNASDELRCGDNSCDPATRKCTDTKRATVDICGGCVADSECKPMHACIPLFFGAEMEPQGGHCMKLISEGCAFPYGATPLEKASLSGASEAEYCGINELTTTCAAIKALQDGKGCPGGEAALCEAGGARCEPVNSVAELCTYACALSAECPTGAPCKGPEGAKYCGGPN
jgi:hypothetical protein